MHRPPRKALPTAWRLTRARTARSFWMTWTHYYHGNDTYEGWGYFHEEGYESSMDLQTRLVAFLRNTAGWAVSTELW